MAEEIVEVTDVVTEKEKSDKDTIKALKKQVKELTAERDDLNNKCNEAMSLIDALRKGIAQRDDTINRMSMDFSRTTKFIKDALGVFVKTICMAFKEDL